MDRQHLTCIFPATRVLNALIRLFFNQMAADSTLKTLMMDIRRIHKERLQEVRDLLGINLVMMNDTLKAHATNTLRPFLKDSMISQFPDKKHSAWMMSDGMKECAVQFIQ